MIDIVGTSCTGCFSCMARCPKNAISAVSHAPGFRMPKINKQMCIECNLCEKVCPILSEIPGISAPISYATQNEEKPGESSSGGAFSAIAKHILNLGGKVYGASMHNGRSVRHTGISTISELPVLCGSKYVQSHISPELYLEIENSLKQDAKILFVGTPCQVQALQLFLRKPYAKLFTIDLICHGVPSDGIFEDYINYCEKLRKKKISDFKFRDNREGWNNIFKSTILYSNGSEEYNTPLANLWNRIFFSELVTRPSCSRCEFASLNRVGDLTLGDFWGVKKDVAFEQEQGVSLVMCNSEKGQQLLANSNLRLIEATTNPTEHPNLYRPTPINNKAVEFAVFYQKHGFGKAVKRYFSFSRWLDFKIRTYYFLKKITD